MYCYRLISPATDPGTLVVPAREAGEPCTGSVGQMNMTITATQNTCKLESIASLCYLIVPKTHSILFSHQKVYAMKLTTVFPRIEARASILIWAAFSGKNSRQK